MSAQNRYLHTLKYLPILLITLQLSIKSSLKPKSSQTFQKLSDSLIKDLKQYCTSTKQSTLSPLNNLKLPTSRILPKNKNIRQLNMKVQVYLKQV